jgi:hypothetical protein
MISSLDLKVCVGKNWCLKLAFRLLNGLLSHADFNLFRIQVDVKNHKYCSFYETKSSDMIAHLCKTWPDIIAYFVYAKQGHFVTNIIF